MPDDFKPPRVPDLWEASQENWERGRPDYLGVNAFEEIRRRLDDVLGERMSYDYHDPSKADDDDDGGRGTEEESEVEDCAEAEEPPPPQDDRHSWEVGQPDYMGRASFDFILKRMAATIGREEIVVAKKMRSEVAESKKSSSDEREKRSEIADSKKSSSDDCESPQQPSLIVPKRRVALGARGSVVESAQSSLPEKHASFFQVPHYLLLQ